MPMTWINVSGDPSDARYAAVWVASDGRAWAGLHNLDAAGYQQRFNELTARGLTPSVVSAAGPVGRAVFAALFEQRDVGAWTARHGLTWGASGQPDTMVGQSELAYAAGQVPRCLAVYGDANDRRFAGIWWEARDGISASWWLGDGDFYQRLFDAQVGGGNRPSSLAVSDDGLGSQFATVVDGQRDTESTLRNTRPVRPPTSAGPPPDASRQVVLEVAQYAAYLRAGKLLCRARTVTVDAQGPDALAAELDATMADTMRRFGVRSGLPSPGIV
jgi:hypothetical protein